MLWLDQAAEAPPPWSAAAAALGNFDGVHRGHQALAAVVLAEARERGCTALALTFDPHPAQVLAPERAPRPLMELQQRADALLQCGIEQVAVLRFSVQIARQPAEAFVREWLVERLRLRCVAVGPDFRFGQGRLGDVRLLERLGRELGFACRVVEPVLEGGRPVSSTRVRSALADGEVAEATRLLGRPHELQGAVERGDARGRLLGFPTANLEPPSVCVPQRGVYAGLARLADGRRRACVVNVGLRPTFAGEDLRVEAHLLDFQGDLYGSRLRLAFVARLREERRFEGVAALKAQIEADVAKARALLVEV